MARRPMVARDIEITTRVNRRQIERISKRLKTLIHNVKNLDAFWDKVGDYMVRSTENRILRQKTDFETGEPWDALSRYSTVNIKGHDRALYQSGELAHSIYVKRQDANGVTISSSAEHAAAMQEGVPVTGGFIPNRTVPSRRFLGVSPANLRRISALLREHVTKE